MMIARRKKTRERRTEILNRLSGLAGKAGRFQASRRGHHPGDGEGSRIEPLCRAFADLGPVFAAYGVYLSTRGDLLTPADRRSLAEIGRDAPPLPPPVVRAIVRVETGRGKVGAGEARAPSDAIASLEDDPFDTRLLFQRHHGRLTSGHAVVVRVVRPERSADSDLDLLLLLRDIVTPSLNDGRLFAQSVDDFRASFTGETDGLALADALEFLGHDARDLDSLRIPKIYREISSPRVLVLERLPGRRLGAVANADTDDPRSEPGRGDGLARLLCELWLRQAFDGGLVPTDPRPENVVVLGRSQVAIDEGTFAVLPNETRQNLLKYLVAVAIDEPCKALDCLLKEFEGTRHRAPFDQLDRLFRQMVPDLTRDEPIDGPAGRLAATVLAQWRLAIENGYRPLRHGLPLLRGVVRLSETVGVLAPGRDALLEGLKDYRVTRLLGDVHAMFEPMYWLSRFDRIATLMMSSPRFLDDALSAAAPDRAAEERKAPGPGGQLVRGAPWVIPALVALAAVGLTYDRGATFAGGPWGEAPAALLFVLFGCWLLGSVIDRNR